MPLSVSKSQQLNSLENIKLIETIFNTKPTTQDDFQSIMNEKFRDRWYINAKPGFTKAYTAIIRLIDRFIYYTINLADVSEPFMRLHPSILLFETPLINNEPIAQSNSMLESALDPVTIVPIQKILLDKLKNDVIFRSEFESLVIHDPLFEQNNLAESSAISMQLQEDAPYILTNVYAEELLPQFDDDVNAVNHAMRRLIGVVINLHLLDVSKYKGN